jgi:HEAT repeat protein
VRSSRHARRPPGGGPVRAALVALLVLLPPGAGDARGLSPQALEQAFATARREARSLLRQRRPPGLGDVESAGTLGRAIAAAVVELGDADRRVQDRGLTKLMYLGRLALSEVIAGTTAPSRTTRMWCAVLLGQLGSAAVAPLGRVLRTDPDPFIRGTAASSLAATHDPRAVPVLLAALAEAQDLSLTTSVIHALTDFRDARAVGPLRRLVPSRAFQGQLQQAAARALIYLDRDAGAKAIREVMATEPDPVRRSGLGALLRPSDTQFPYWPPALLELHLRTREARTIAGERFGPREIDELRRHIGSPHWWVSYDCLHALGELRASSAVPAIVALDPKTHASFEALAMIASAPAINRLVAAIESPDRATRERAIEALRFGGRWTVPILIELLGDATLRQSHRAEPPEEINGRQIRWPDSHLAHTVLHAVLGRAGLAGRHLNLASGATLDLDAEITRLRAWWQTHGRAFLDGARVPDPQLTSVYLDT